MNQGKQLKRDTFQSANLGKARLTGSMEESRIQVQAQLASRIMPRMFLFVALRTIQLVEQHGSKNPIVSDYVPVRLAAELNTANHTSNYLWDKKRIYAVDIEWCEDP